jgi:hypothetical protein
MTATSQDLVMGYGMPKEKVNNFQKIGTGIHGHRTGGVSIITGMGTMAACATASDGAQSPAAAESGPGELPPPGSAGITAQEFGKFDPTRPNIARVYDYR